MSDDEDPMGNLAMVFHLAALHLHDLSKRSDSLSVEMQINVGQWICEYERTATWIFANYPEVLKFLKRTVETGRATSGK